MASPNPAIEKARQSSLRKLCERLGYEFQDIGLLDRALTHASMGNEGKKSYERLEFLGDSFVNFAVADALYRRDSEFAEGQLTETRARIVSRQPLANAARASGLALACALMSGDMVRAPGLSCGHTAVSAVHNQPPRRCRAPSRGWCTTTVARD